MNKVHIKPISVYTPKYNYKHDAMYCHNITNMLNQIKFQFRLLLPKGYSNKISDDMINLAKEELKRLKINE